MSTSFSSLGVPEDISACLEALGITEPYPIQSATLPDGLAGRDLFAQSPTGSGKTLAFSIPLVTRIGRLGRAGRGRSCSRRRGSSPPRSRRPFARWLAASTAAWPPFTAAPATKSS